jgi:putative oxidoreductase
LNSKWTIKVIHSYAALAARLYIGGVFIYASLSKITYSAEFAEIIASYQMVPEWSVNLLAIILPWSELVCGGLLIIGLRSKSAVALLAGMLALFSLSIAINLARGTPIGCGCFSSLETPMTWTTLLRDLIWLAMTLYIYKFDKRFQIEKRFLPAITTA